MSNQPMTGSNIEWAAQLIVMAMRDGFPASEAADKVRANIPDLSADDLATAFGWACQLLTNKSEQLRCLVTLHRACSERMDTPNISSEHKAEEIAHEATMHNDVQIVGDGSYNWAVVSKAGSFRFGEDELPCIIHAGLDTVEAAEVARWFALLRLADQTRYSPYFLNKATISFFNAAGRVVAKLRESGVKADDMIAFAVDITESAAERSSNPADWSDDTDKVPF